MEKQEEASVEAQFSLTESARLAKSVYRAAKGRSGLALCLSGGGFRASLFHLGAVRRLNELGILSKVTTISSVSGGSILSAHLATTLKPIDPLNSALARAAPRPPSGRSCMA